MFIAHPRGVVLKRLTGAEKVMIDPQLSASAPQSRRVGWRAGLQQFYRGRLVRNILTTISGSAGAQAINLALIPVIMRIYEIGRAHV